MKIMVQVIDSCTLLTTQRVWLNFRCNLCRVAHLIPHFEPFMQHV